MPTFVGGCGAFGGGCDLATSAGRRTTVTGRSRSGEQGSVVVSSRWNCHSYPLRQNTLHEGASTVAAETPFIQHGVNDLEFDYDDWFTQTKDRLALVRGIAEFEPTLRDICREAFRTYEMAPSELVDYMVVSSPGVFEEAGYSEEEMDLLVHVFDRIVEEEWATQRAG